MAKPFDGTNGKYGSSASGSTSSRSPDPDPIAEKIRELQAYADVEDDDTTVTGNHNIVAMPGSHVHITSDPDMESEIPMARFPKWGRTVAKVLGALVGLGTLAKAIYEATKR